MRDATSEQKSAHATVERFFFNAQKLIESVMVGSHEMIAVKKELRIRVKCNNLPSFDHSHDHTDNRNDPDSNHFDLPLPHIRIWNGCYDVDFEELSD